MKKLGRPASPKVTNAARKRGAAVPGGHAAKVARKRGFQDPVGRYLHEHRGALGKDYKLDY